MISPTTRTYSRYKVTENEIEDSAKRRRKGRRKEEKGRLTSPPYGKATLVGKTIIQKNNSFGRKSRTKSCQMSKK